MFLFCFPHRTHQVIAFVAVVNNNFHQVGFFFRYSLVNKLCCTHHSPKMTPLPKDMYLSFAVSYVESLASPFPQLENGSTIDWLF